jgi:hypothetical protein
MMEREIVSETSDANSILSQLITWEDLIAYTCPESFYLINRRNFVKCYIWMVCVYSGTPT